MAEQGKWQWQEPGTAWKGIGLYHITLTIPDRLPLLGTLDILDNDPTKAKVRRMALGNALVNCLLSIQQYHQEVQVLHFCLMPDHLHAVLYVRRTMPTGISTVVRGFWQAAKKLARAFSMTSSLAPSSLASSSFVPSSFVPSSFASSSLAPSSLASSFLAPSSLAPNAIRENTQEVKHLLQAETTRLEAFSATLRKEMGDEAYYRLPPIFTEMPFIRPMGHSPQLPNTIRYIDMNPQRLATKRLKPGLFRVQRNITIGERNYDGVGNTTLLLSERFDTVHVRSSMVKAAEHGDAEMLRNYMNSCALKARQGVVLVSPFISPQEKQVMDVLLREQHPFICLADNGFRDYYKPVDSLFDACAAGRVLILSPWPYDANKRRISRADCVALNAMAEEICSCLNSETPNR